MKLFKNPSCDFGSIISARFAFIAICASIFVLMAAGLSYGQREGVKDFFYSNGHKHELVVSDISFGVVARDTISSEDMGILADSLGYSVIRKLPQNIYIIGLNNATSRDSLADIARNFQSHFQNLIKYSGLVTTPVNADVPLITTDEFIVKFHENVDSLQVDTLNNVHGVKILEKSRYVPNQYVLKVLRESDSNGLEMANRYHQMEIVEFSHPNFVRVIEYRQSISNDTYIDNQWHLQNTGQSGGTIDADIDAELAWAIESGKAGTIIAVLDDGFDMEHPDLTPNFWINQPEKIGVANIDDDGNGLIDDIHGWDFDDSDEWPAAEDDPNPILPAHYDDHGTAVAGAAVARGDNGIGVSGSCQECGLMMLRIGSTDNSIEEAFEYASDMGARIINCSWGFKSSSTAINNGISYAANAGAVIFFAKENTSFDDCVGIDQDISSHGSVIAVSASTNIDRWGDGGFGDCMDLLAPGVVTTPGPPAPYELWGVTTDRQGADGYNNTNPDPNAYCPAEVLDQDYTFCLKSASIATPIASGVAGLILSANTNLDRTQVQNLLQDTADKIEHSKGEYDPNTGFSSPSTGTATHGWGRINAFEAVRIAASSADGGKNGVDIFLRDNRLDWGNTEQRSSVLFEPTRGFIKHWRSMDIKVDAWPYEAAPTAATFDAFIDETPTAVAGEPDNRVFVRVRNRGPVTAADVKVKLLWTQFSAGLPSLPSDFWSNFPGNGGEWTPLNCAGSSVNYCSITDLAYSGASAAKSPATDAAQIVQFDFPPPPYNQNKSNHFCLLAIVHSPQDPITTTNRVVDFLTPTENNITHRNYHNLSTAKSSKSAESFYVRNPFQHEIRTRLRHEAPENWKVELDSLRFDEWFSMDAGLSILATVKVNLPEPNLSGEVSIIQDILHEDNVEPLGGLTLGFTGDLPDKPIPEMNNVYPYLIGSFDLRHGRHTTFTIINPTAKYLRILVAFFDDNENPLGCQWEKLSPNDMVEIDTRKHIKKNVIGVAKIVSFHIKKDKPDHGIVGFQKHYRKSGFLFWRCHKVTAESPLQPITYEVLKLDLEKILSACP
ncbi:MAG: S8 family serine peptidase [candidate division Zixibacteria bacterium]|nr:S8 family serine peptidase [candidate division Zixibacteria bacterium]